MADTKDEGIKVVSFDIFNTLILRPFAKPSDMHWLMEQELNDPGFHDRRIKAECEARKIKKSEVTLDEIYHRLDVPEKYKELECELEISLCFRNEKVCKELESYSKNHMIMLTSDDPLPRLVIEKILDKNSIHYDRLYLSSETDLTKRSGKMFDHILDSLSVKPDEMLHIGDDKNSDVKVPKRKGIRTSFRRSPISEYLREHFDERRYLHRHYGLTASVIIAMDMIRTENEDVWYDIGNRYGGPLAYAYTRYLMDHCDKGSMIAFASRDCYSIKRCFEYLCPGAKTCYIHPQRLLKDVFFSERL